MNYGTSQNPKSLFLNVIMASTVQYDKDLNAISRTLLNDIKLRKRQNGETTDLETFKSEEQRIEAIDRVFGIKLSQEERDGIKGRKVAMDQYGLQN
jgi:hypothetical protein